MSIPLCFQYITQQLHELLFDPLELHKSEIERAYLSGTRRFDPNQIKAVSEEWSINKTDKCVAVVAA